MNPNWRCTQAYCIFWQALRTASEFHLSVLLFYWASLSILNSGICSSISTRCVRHLLQSVEEPSDSWETEHCVNFLCRGTLPSYHHWSTRRILKDDGWRLSDLLSRPSQALWLPLHDEPILGPPLRSPVIKDWGGEAMSRQEADNQIIQDCVSHLTCMDPVSVLKSVIQSMEELFVCLCVRGREKETKKFSALLCFFLYFYLSFTYSFCIFFLLL